MSAFRKKVFAAAGYTTIFMGAGRPEFFPDKPMRPFEEYLLETAQGTCRQLPTPFFDEGVIGSFMSARFIKQANLPGFLPLMVPALRYQPCTAVEGACGTGGRAIATAVHSILSDESDAVFVAGFEMQNTMKSIYGADVLAGAAYYHKERKAGHAYFFPGIFSERAAAYYEKYGYDLAREGMAKWYENAILNARHNPKAQEYHNKSPDLFALGMTAPDPERFVPALNFYDCSKVSDGAASIGIFSEEGLARNGIPSHQAVEIVAIGAAEDDISRSPEDLTALTTTEHAVRKALERAALTVHDMGIIEVHDCFTITGLLSIEALGLVPRGKAAEYIQEGKTTRTSQLPINVSGGLGGFGHPTGATGVRQLVDLQQQLTHQSAANIHPKKPHGLLISMGGNDKTVTVIIVKSL